MGNFSRDTFDRLKHYVSVRLQQGVPIVDADWNELQDIRKHELETFLKWFVGNGVPVGGDGFAIDGTSAGPNDLVIAAGRCLVEGWDVVNESPERYTEQALYGNAALAAAWGVAPLAALTTPASDRLDTVYLDVWEREVGAAEDDDIVNPDIGIETSVRTRREWAVRVAEGTSTPPSAPPGHVFYPLATLDRKANKGVIEIVTDRRRTGLTIISNHDLHQIVGDAFGPFYPLAGDRRLQLKVSLREAVNALLSGGLPGTPPLNLTFDTAADFDPNVIRDSSGGIWVFWRSYRGASYANIWCRRYDPATASWTVDTQLTNGPLHNSDPFPVVDSAGNVWIFWLSYRDGRSNVWSKRYDRASGTWGAETQITSDASNVHNFFHVLADSAGRVWVFWSSFRNSDYGIWYRRYTQAGNTWANEAQVVALAGHDYYPHAMEDSEGVIWLFWSHYNGSGYNLWSSTFSGSTWSSLSQVTFGAADSDYTPQALEIDSGEIMLFWPRQGNVWLRVYNRLNLAWGSEIQLTSGLDGAGSLVVVRGAEGDVWVFWTSGYAIHYKRYGRESVWGPQVRATPLRTSAEEFYTSASPSAVTDDSGDLWIFWESYGLVGSSYYRDITFRRLLTEI